MAGIPAAKHDAASSRGGKHRRKPPRTPAPAREQGREVRTETPDGQRVIRDGHPNVWFFSGKVR
jgi:hypothetical protein